MKNPIPHLRAFQAFDMAGTLSNLSRAAESMNLTHGAVSRQIKQLEEYLGAQLLYRHPGGVKMTEAGEQLHMATQQAFSALRSGIEKVQRNQDPQSVTITLSSSLATKWLVPRLPDFRASHPGLNMFLDTNDDMVDFAESDVDVALRYGVPNWSGLHCERLVSEELIVAASPALIQNETLPMTPAAISRLPLLHDSFNPAWNEWADAVGLPRSQLGAPKLMFGDSAVLITSAADGQGVALVRRLLAQDDLAAGRIIRLDNSSVSLGRALYFVCRQGDQDKPAIRSLRNWLFSVLG